MIDIPEAPRIEIFNPLDFMDKKLEITNMPIQSTILNKSQHKTSRIHLKAKKRNEIKLEHLAELMPILPETGYSLHVISSGNFDFWTYVPHIINLAGGINDFYVSTSTMNRTVAEEMLELIDSKQVKKMSLMTGLYFKRRETAVYAMILQGLLKRGMRYIAFMNHTKIMLLEKYPDYFVIEGSANLTANPRAEQFILTNDKALYEFHKSWMEEMYNAR